MTLDHRESGGYPPLRSIASSPSAALKVDRTLKSVAIAAGVLMAIAFDRPLSSQAPETVDFARDVQPILTERCGGCHGPTQQMSGYRLDRRSAAMGGVLRSNIVPGSSESSRMFSPDHRQPVRSADAADRSAPAG
jgi:cytochrome c